MMDLQSYNTEYKMAIKLFSVPRNCNSQEDSLFLTCTEKHELAKLCINVKTFFDWNFNFQEFYEIVIRDHFPLEFFWILHIYQVMPFEIYILSFRSQNSSLQKFTQNISKLCAEDFEENEAKFHIQTGILSYFVSRAFSTAEVTVDETVKEISKEVIRSLLKDIFSTKEEVKTRRFSCFFSLWVAGLLEDRSLFYFCSFALDFYLDFLPSTKDVDAFELLEHSHTNASPYHLLTVVEKLVKIQKKDGIIHLLKCAVKKNEVNAKALLVIVKAFLGTHKDAAISISKLVSELMIEAYNKSSYDILLRSLLIGYQTYYLSNTPPQVHYRFWLQTVFKECNHSKDRNSYSLLIQVLSDIVPYYKNSECIKVAIDSNFCIPHEFQSIYDDYVVLLKTRFQDLKPPARQEVTVEKVLLLYESLGKIPPVVLEISLLQKHFYLNEFLPALLIPRVIPSIPDVRERFIEALNKAGKMPNSLLQKYKNSCLEKQKVIEDVNMIEENLDDFIEDYI